MCNRFMNDDFDRSDNICENTFGSSNAFSVSFIWSDEIGAVFGSFSSLTALYLLDHFDADSVRVFFCFCVVAIGSGEGVAQNRGRPSKSLWNSLLKATFSRNDLVYNIASIRSDVSGQFAYSLLTFNMMKLLILGTISFSKSTTASRSMMPIAEIIRSMNSGPMRGFCVSIRRKNIGINGRNFLVKSLVVVMSSYRKSIYVYGNAFVVSASEAWPAMRFAIFVRIASRLGFGAFGRG